MGTTIKSAWKAYHRGQVDEARTLFSELATANQQSSQVCTQKGLFHLSLDEFDHACESLQAACQREEKNPAPLFLLALAQELAGQEAQSQASVERLRLLCPHHQGRTTLRLLHELRRGDPTLSLRKFGFGPQEPTQQPKLNQRLMASLGLGDPDWLPSDLSSSNYLLGPILLEVESRLHALEVPALEHHGALLPEDLDGLKPGKRDWRKELRNFRLSIKAGNAMKNGRSLLEKAFGLADLEKQRSLLERAVLYLRTARKHDPHTFRVNYHLAECYIFLAKKGVGLPFDRFRLLQAQSACLESAQKEGVNPYLLFYLAYVQHLLGRPKLAILYYQEATKKFEKLPEAHYGQGQCHLLLGDRKKARECMLKAVNSDLALARERLESFSKVLATRGAEHFQGSLPTLPPEPDLRTDIESDPTNQPETSEPADSTAPEKEKTPD